MANPRAPVPETLPEGYRFHPTENEIMKYLRNCPSTAEQSPSVDSRSCIIVQLDVYEKDPWDLRAFSKVNPNGPDWFFFTQLEKYRNSNRTKRKTPSGYWKLTGKPLEIKAEGSENKVIGTKQILVFQRRGDSADVGKGDWVIHEYREADSSNSHSTSVLCRLIDKTEKDAARGKIKRGREALIDDQDESSRRMALPDENLASCDLLLFESGVENSIDPPFN